MENQEVTPEGASEGASFEFISDDVVQQAQQAQQAEPVEQPQEQQVADIQQESTEPVVENIENNESEVSQEAPEESYTDEEIEGAVFSYLSERLGTDINSFDDFSSLQQESELDERVEAISRFVNETGRDPKDWLTYQQLDSSEMDDLTAVKFKMLSDYNNLNAEELDTLITSKYKLDPNLHTEEEVRLSKLQLKLDAKTAKDQIEKLREQYAAPLEEEQQDYESPITEDWVYNMAQQLDELKGIEFDLPSGETFTFGLTDQYKVELGEKNVRLDEYFDSYVRKDGSWDYDKLNMHRSVIDNIDTIVQSVYKQGMADGQRGIVNKAANVSTNSPNQGVAQPESSPLADQLRNALGLNRGFGSNS